MNFVELTRKGVARAEIQQLLNRYDVAVFGFVASPSPIYLKQRINKSHTFWIIGPFLPHARPRWVFGLFKKVVC